MLGKHGVSDEERSAAQPFELDIDVVTDITRAAATDDLADTVDYQALAQDASRIVVDGSFHFSRRSPKPLQKHFSHTMGSNRSPSLFES